MSCFKHLLKVLWCLIALVTVLTIIEFDLYQSKVSQSYKSRLSSIGIVPRAAAGTSNHSLSCSFTHHQRRRVLAAQEMPLYHCKNSRNNDYKLDHKKFIIARYTAELESTNIEESNLLNLLLNAIDLGGSVVHDATSLITSQCVLSTDKTTPQQCVCTCIQTSDNSCTHQLTAGPSDTMNIFNSNCTSVVNVSQPADYNQRFQKVLCDNGLPELSTINTFFNSSYRDIAFIQPINIPVYNITREQQLIQDQLRLNSSIIDCSNHKIIYSMSVTVLKELNDIAAMLCLEGFKMAGVYCIAGWYKSNDLGMYWFADDNVSIIFTSWNGLARDNVDDILIEQYNESITSNNNNNKRVTVPQTKDTVRNHIVMASRRADNNNIGKLVIKQTKTFLKTLLTTRQQYIVIHIRVDDNFSAYTKHLSNFSRSYQNCLALVSSCIDQLITNNTDRSVFVFIDRATNNINESIATLQMNLIQSTLLKDKYQIHQYSPGKYGGRSDPMFVTLVEQEFMCRASYLVTIGGGEIQTRLKKRFLTMHFRKKLYDYQYC